MNGKFMVTTWMALSGVGILAGCIVTQQPIIDPNKQVTVPVSADNATLHVATGATVIVHQAAPPATKAPAGAGQAWTPEPRATRTPTPEFTPGSPRPTPTASPTPQPQRIPKPSTPEPTPTPGRITQPLRWPNPVPIGTPSGTPVPPPRPSEVTSRTLVNGPGSMTGQVAYEDPVAPSGYSFIQNASITIRSVAAPEQGAALVAGESGAFSLSNVPLGRYSVKVEASGFATQEATLEVKATYSPHRQFILLKTQ